MMTLMNIFGLFIKSLKFSGLLRCFICILICYISRSPACFELKWPMREESPFLFKPKKRKRVSFTVDLCPKFIKFLSSYVILTFVLMLCETYGNFSS